MRLINPHLIVHSILPPPGVTSSLTCPAGQGSVQDLVTNPCVCIASGTYTGRPNCDSHSGGAPFCHTPLLCPTGNTAAAFPETLWRPCDPAVDNSPVYECGPCKANTYSDGESEFCDVCPANSETTNPFTEDSTTTSGPTSITDCLCHAGWYMNNSSCTPCPADTYNPSVGATHSSQCLACLEGSRSGPNSLSCAPPLSTSLVNNAVDAINEGGTVFWQSGTGVLEQTWSGEDGWDFHCI